MTKMSIYEKNHKDDFKIYIDQYSDNGYSSSDKYSAIFNVSVN